MREQVKFDMRVPALVKQEGELFVAHCAALDVTSQGPSEQKALSNLVEALQLFIETCYEMGTIDQVLKEHGFHPGDVDENVDESGWLNVPLSLVASNAQNCAV